ncbi:type II secretion system minor pseudopilin GspJ [Thiobacillus sp.]|uniref:type II secretion system minor pseudopilin GspJ n=1 Tax=Thiobacillus sp. TaxID=924 RepID=UPI0025CECE88|nr:type II secretion system minor pseudopilin GspJ [Thiobacillus sp.]
MRQRGFTLVEMLVALTIFALMSVLAYRGLNAALQTRAHLTEDNRRWRDIALTLAQLEQDMGLAVDRPVRGSGGLPLPAFIGSPQAPGVDDVQLGFSRMGMAWQSGVLADVQRYGYRLNKGTLEQLVWPVLDQAPRSEPAVHPLLERVRRFELRYLDGSGNWQSRWPLPGLAALPAALEVVLELDGGVAVTRVFALP